MEKYVFWGAGRYGLHLASVINPDRVICFCDNNKSGVTQDGKKIISPTELLCLKDEYTLVIAVDHQKYMFEILEQTRFLHVNVLLPPQFLLREKIRNLDYYPWTIKSFMQTYGFTELTLLTDAEIIKMNDFWGRYKHIEILSLQTANISVFCYSFSEFCKQMELEDDNDTFYCMARDGDFSCPKEKELYLTYNIPNVYAYKKFSEKIFTLNADNINFYCNIFCWNYDKVRIFDYDALRENAVRQGKMFFGDRQNNKKNSNRRTISFTSTECKNGTKILKQLGISRDYVCFFARDNVYLDATNKNLPDKTLEIEDTYRNSDIMTFDLMARKLDEMGIDAVRMGSMVKNRYQGKGIDYSNISQSDFMDLYLFSNCLFFIGDNSGISAIPKTLFGKPVVCIVSPHTLLYCGDLMTPRDILLIRKLYDPKTCKYLSMKDILSMNKRFGNNIVAFEKAYFEAGIQSIPVSAEEIWEAAEEMLMLILGRKKYSSEDMMLRENYMKIISDYSNEFSDLVASTGYICASWLKRNTWFLE